MQVTMTVVRGGGKEHNRTSHSKTLKDVTTWEEAMEDLKKEFKPFFPVYKTFDETEGKKVKEK